jgi:Ca2+/H+ antiporter
MGDLGVLGLLSVIACLSCFVCDKGQVLPTSTCILSTSIADLYIAVVGLTERISMTKGHPMGGLLCLFGVVYLAFLM